MDDHKCVRVVWVDSGYMAATDGWTPYQKVLDHWKPSHMETITVGLLMYEDNDVIGVALTYSPSTTAVFSMQYIARQNIKTLEVLHA